MPSLHRSTNPFAMMIDPQAVIARMERSERLGHLQRRICRPLDRPLLGPAGEPLSDPADGDDADLLDDRDAE